MHLSINHLYSSIMPTTDSAEVSVTHNNPKALSNSYKAESQPLTKPIFRLGRSTMKNQNYETSLQENGCLS